MSNKQNRNRPIRDCKTCGQRTYRLICDGCSTRANTSDKARQHKDKYARSDGAG